MSEQNKATARRFIEEAWNKGNLNVIDEVIADGYVNHDPQAKGVDSPEALKGLVNMYRTAFPDLVFEIQDLMADGDKVIARWTTTGTQLGPLPDIPATGRQVHLTGISISRFENGKMAEDWANWDTIGMLQQLGLMH